MRSIAAWMKVHHNVTMSAPAAKAPDDAKWRKALVKKLRFAATVKARIESGETLQSDQKNKGSYEAIETLLKSLVTVGVEKDAAEVKAALKAGKEDARGAAPRKAENAAKAAALDAAQKAAAEVRRARLTTSAGDGAGAKSGGGGVGGGGVTGAGAGAGGGGGAGGGKDYSKVKTAVWALHAIAKDPTAAAAAAADAVPVITAVTNLTALAATADARLTGTALWAAAKIAARMCGSPNDASTTPTATSATPSAATKTTTTGAAAAAAAGAGTGAAGAVAGAAGVEDVAALVALAAALGARAGVIARDGKGQYFDARGVSTALWALATFARTSSGGGGGGGDGVMIMAPAAAAAAARPLLKVLATTGAKCNPQDAANALWACARLHLPPPKACAAALVLALCGSGGSGGGGPAKPHEMSMALWALASLHADGTLPSAPAAAAPLAAAAAVKAKAAATDSTDFSPQAVANAAWAAGKLCGGAGGAASADESPPAFGGVGERSALGETAAEVAGAAAAGGAATGAAAAGAENDSIIPSEMVTASRALVSALATHAAAAPPGAFTGQAGGYSEHPLHHH